MEKCPKCGAELSDGVTECPACGIVLAKYRPAAGTSPAPRPAVAPRPAAEPAMWPPAQVAPTPPITASTMAALHSARPWMRFLAGYGFVVLSLILLLAVGLLVVGIISQPEILALSFFYLLYALVGFAVVVPLWRSSTALREVKAVGPSTALEQFAVHQAQFWRRMGVITVIAVGLGVIALLFMMLAGGMAAMGQ